jgi:hypothetical protein
VQETGYQGGDMADESEEITRIEERIANRRAKTKKQEEEMQKAIREAEERRDPGRPTE